MTLKPAQCAVYLRPTPARKNIFYRGFNRVYDRCEAMLRRGRPPRSSGTSPSMMLVFAGLVALTGWWFTRLPTGFLPTEDQGYAIVGIQLPDAASQTRTRAVVEQGRDAILKKTPGVRSWFLIGGQSILDQAVASNAAAMYVDFTPWEERTGKPGAEHGGDPRPTSWAQVAADPRGDRSSPSRRRRSRAWASRAGSRCSSRTAAASGLERAPAGRSTRWSATATPRPACGAVKSTFRAGVPISTPTSTG